MRINLPKASIAFLLKAAPLSFFAQNISVVGLRSGRSESRRSRVQKPPPWVDKCQALYLIIYA